MHPPRRLRLQVVLAEPCVLALLLPALPPLHQAQARALQLLPLPLPLPRLLQQPLR